MTAQAAGIAGSIEPIEPSGEDTEQVRGLLQALRGERQLGVELDGRPLRLPPEVHRALLVMASLLADGEPILVVPATPELTRWAKRRAAG